MWKFISKYYKLILIVLIIIVGILLFSPTIINFFAEKIKLLNPEYINLNLDSGDWLSFYATLIGTIITFLTVVISVCFGIYEIKRQHRENAASLEYQAGVDEINILSDKISKLLYEYTRTDISRKAFSLLGYSKYDEAFALIEEARSNMLKINRELFICTDINEVSMYNSNDEELKEYENIKSKIRELIVKIDKLCNDLYNIFQNQLNFLHGDIEKRKILQIYKEQIDNLRYKLKLLNTSNSENKSIEEIERTKLEINKLNKELKENEEKCLSEEKEHIKIKENVNKEVEKYSKNMKEIEPQLVDNCKKYVMLRKKMNNDLYNKRFCVNKK